MRLFGDRRKQKLQKRQQRVISAPENGIYDAFCDISEVSGLMVETKLWCSASDVQSVCGPLVIHFFC